MSWTPQQAEAHNARVAAGRLKTAKQHNAEQGVGEYEFREFRGGGISNTSMASPAAHTGLPAAPIKFVIKTPPVAAPRMTRRDKWLKPRRPCVQQYFDYRDVLQRAVGDIPTVPDEMSAKFFIPMPPSWPASKREKMNGSPHRQRPDADNLMKAVMDALFTEDGGVWCCYQEKRWCNEDDAKVELQMIWR